MLVKIVKNMTMVIGEKKRSPVTGAFEMDDEAALVFIGEGKIEMVEDENLDGEDDACVDPEIQEIVEPRDLAPYEQECTIGDLFAVAGMTDDLAEDLAGVGVVLCSDLANASVDLLTAIKGVGRKRAKKLIAAAQQSVEKR